VVEIVGGRRRWSRPLTQRVIRPTLLHYYYYYYYYSFFFGSASLPLLYLQVGWKRRRSAARRRPRGDGSAEAASPAPVVPRPGRSGRSAPRPLRSFRATAAPDGRPRTAPLHFPIDDSIHYRTPDCRGNPRSKESSGADSLDNQLRAMVMK